MARDRQKFHCKDIVFGADIDTHPLFKFAESLQPRDLLNEMIHFGVHANKRVGALFGLRRTGKSVLLRQWLNSLSPDEKCKSAYITVDSETLYNVKEDLRTLKANGFRSVVIDEITVCEDFMSGAAALANEFAGSDMRIFIAGTDSLSIWLTSFDQLFDRDYLLHTTHIPFCEWRRLVGGNRSLDEYIQWGGLLHLEPTEGEIRHSSPLPWTADEKRRYFTASISNNLQNSLRNYKNGERAGILSSLIYSSSIDDAAYGLFACISRKEFMEHLAGLSKISDKNLISALQSVVSHESHKFDPFILRKKFKSPDLSRTAHALQDKYPHLHDVLLRISKILQQDAERLLNVRDGNGIQLTSGQFIELEKYFRKLDVFAMRPYRAFLPVTPSLEDIDNYELLNIELCTQNIVTQPGLRYAQADIMRKLIETSQLYESLSKDEQKIVIDYFMNGVFGIMQEDIILYETMQHCKHYASMKPGDNDRVRYFSLPIHAYKAVFPNTPSDARDKEIDLIIEDVRDGNDYYCLEIKHTKERTIEQQKWLDDSDVVNRICRGNGSIKCKVILYNGNTCFDEESDVRYISIVEYLEILHTQGIDATLEFLCNSSHDPHDNELSGPHP